MNNGAKTAVFYNIILLYVCTIKNNKTYMTNPYYWDFPKRADTMYMSTICTIAFS